MAYIGLVALCLIIISTVFTYKGLKNRDIFETYSFDVDHVLLFRDYRRLLTAGFLHVNRMHLFFNMFSLLIFSLSLDGIMDAKAYLLIFLAGLVGGNLFSLYIYRNYGDYSAVGASGAVCSVIFAAIALSPGMSVGFFFVPFHVPGWIYGLFFVLYSIYNIRSKRDNIGHEAHLGGALIGMMTALILHPAALVNNYATILLIIIPTVIFIYVIINRPYTLLIDNLFFRNHQMYIDIDHRYNADRAILQQQVDMVLEKVHKRGMKSLTRRERELLTHYSQTI